MAVTKARTRRRSEGAARDGRAAQNTGSGTTRERLLLAAGRLFAEKGFYGASLRDMGRELGMPNASLLHHFPTKGRIYAAVLERAAESLSAVVAAARRAENGDARAEFAALFDGLFDWHREEPHFARLVMRELLDNAERAEEVERWVFADVLRELAARIEAGQASGAVRPCDAMGFVFHLIGAVSYFFAGLPTLAGITGTDPDALSASYREELRRQLERTLFE